MCGYSDSTLIVISRAHEIEDQLVASGLLIDLRPPLEIRFPSSFFDYTLHRLKLIDCRASEDQGSQEDILFLKPLACGFVTGDP